MLARHGVIVVPGDDFKVPGISSHCSSEQLASSPSTTTPPAASTGEVVLRLSYAASSPELIEAGIARLVEGIKDALD